MKRPLIYNLAWVGFFGICMAYIEAAVVVDLRMLYYPEGFYLSLKPMPLNMVLIEVGREAATIFMLIAIGFIAGKSFWERFSYFIYSFGIWDIFYYIWLKVFLNWPPSLLTWDILYLIPAPWVAPVLAPVIVAFSMVIVAVIILYFEGKGYCIKLTKWQWIILALVVLVIFVSFIWDSAKIMRQEMPTRYHWELLFIGETLGGGLLALVLKKAAFNSTLTG